MEQWKEIPDCAGRYRVSNTGRVANVVTNRILAPYTTKDGYHRVTLYGNSPACKKFLVHRLVTTAFIGCIDKGFEVNHKNGVKSDNSVGNLEIVTRSDNLVHSHKMGLHNVKGEKHPGHKLTESEVLNIRELKGQYTQKYIAGMFNVSYATVKKIMQRRLWAHI